MGIDAQILKFLCYAHKHSHFKKTITIGRQNLNITEGSLKRTIPTNMQYKKEIYAESLLKDYFHSTIVNSIDKSNYEKATIIHDMNMPIPDNVKEKYDTVIDSGSLEHIYDIAQALENVSHLCKPGGQIIHILPTNNLCGHGFYQISPELFFSLYSSKNGYKDTEVFLAKVSQSNYSFYKVIKPENGKRITLYSKDEINVYVRTVRKTGKFFHNDIQQSDYVHLWNKENKGTVSSWPINFIYKHYLLLNLTRKIYNSPFYRYKITRKNKLSRYNPNLIACDSYLFNYS
jgi:SAM-dependent methyltransferase